VISSLTTDTPFLTIGTTLSKLTDGLFGGEGITSMEDLRGKPIAISTFGGESHAVVVSALRGAGMAPDDVEIVQIGGQSDRIAAVIGGSVAAAPIDIARQSANGRRGIDPSRQPRRDRSAASPWWPERDSRVRRGEPEHGSGDARSRGRGHPAHEGRSRSGSTVAHGVGRRRRHRRFSGRARGVPAVRERRPRDRRGSVAHDAGDARSHQPRGVRRVDVADAYTTEFVEQLEEMGFFDQWGITIE
jgi:hypothetical protein